MGVREKSVRARAAGRMFLAWMTAMVVAAAALGALRQVGTPAVAVHALGPGGLIKIDMESNELSVEEKDGKLVLSSDLRKLTDKENELRAKHMREEFQADQLPSVT
ncbi:MAG TPA: hypothetical protein VJT73_01285, partial [Polyangiaceae bacterium]|nr:hypothetical protein [Polyangiaceae bacterium]